MLNVFPVEKGNLGIEEDLQPLTKRIVGNIRGATWHKIQLSPDHTGTISLNSLKNLGVEWQRNCLGISIGRTSCFLGALAQIDEFRLSPLVKGHSGSIPETSRNALGRNPGTNYDDSQSDPHPGARVSQRQTTQFFGSKWPLWHSRYASAEFPYMWVQEKIV